MPSKKVISTLKEGLNPKFKTVILIIYNCIVLNFLIVV